MIFTALIGLLIDALTGVLGLFPAYTLPSQLTDFSAAVGSWIGTANGFFPVVTLGFCLGAIMVLHVFIFGVRLVVFIYELIPLKFT